MSFDHLYCPLCGAEDFFLDRVEERFGSCSAVCTNCLADYDYVEPGLGSTYEEAIRAYMENMYALMYHETLYSTIDDYLGLLN